MIGGHIKSYSQWIKSLDGLIHRLYTRPDMTNYQSKFITHPLSQTVYRMNQKTFAKAEASNKKLREVKRELAYKELAEYAKKFWSQG